MLEALSPTVGRKLTPYEYEVLVRLCSLDFAGNEFYLKQLEACRVVEEGPCHDLRFVFHDLVQPAPHSVEHSRLLAVAEFFERGNRGSFLLFGKSGLLYFLEKASTNPMAMIGSWRPAVDTIVFKAYVPPG